MDIFYPASFLLPHLTDSSLTLFSNHSVSTSHCYTSPLSGSPQGRSFDLSQLRKLRNRQRYHPLMCVLTFIFYSESVASHDFVQADQMTRAL